MRFHPLQRRGVFLLAGTFLAVAVASLHAEDQVEDVSVFSDSRVIASGHFRLHYEDAYPPAGLLNTLENLYSKLLLDLGGFLPPTGRDPIDIYLYKDTTSYITHTGLDSWAIAHYNARTQHIYGRPDKDLTRILAHELGHLFFTRYFQDRLTAPPLWLNEGVACLMEWDYGQAGETGYRTRALARGAGPAPLGTFMASRYGHGMTTDAVSLWYLQAESLTRYLMHHFSRAQFMTFCGALRDGKTVDASLRAGYGLVLPDTATLERLWRESLADDQK